MNQTQEVSKRKKISFSQFRELNVLVALFLLCLFFYWRRPEIFLKPANIAIIMRFIATFGMLAMGEVLVIITGGIDLSVGSLTALTGVITAWLMLKGAFGLPPFSMGLAIALALLIGALIGIWHGLFITQLGIPPFIITLGTWLIARGLGSFITRGYPQVFPSGSPFLVLGQGRIGSIPIMFLILLGIAFIISVILNRTPLGYRIYAVGGNIEATRLSGVNVDRVRIFCYSTSGFLAALTGVILASRLGQGTPHRGQRLRALGHRSRRNRRHQPAGRRRNGAGRHPGRRHRRRHAERHGAAQRLLVSAGCHSGCRPGHRRRLRHVTPTGTRLILR